VACSPANVLSEQLPPATFIWTNKDGVVQALCIIGLWYRSCRGKGIHESPSNTAVVPDMPNPSQGFPLIRAGAQWRMMSIAPPWAVQSPRANSVPFFLLFLFLFLVSAEYLRPDCGRPCLEPSPVFDIWAFILADPALAIPRPARPRKPLCNGRGTKARSLACRFLRPGFRPPRSIPPCPILGALAPPRTATWVWGAHPFKKHYWTYEQTRNSSIVFPSFCPRVRTSHHSVPRAVLWTMEWSVTLDNDGEARSSIFGSNQRQNQGMTRAPPPPIPYSQRYETPGVTNSWSHGKLWESLGARKTRLPLSRISGPNGGGPRPSPTITVPSGGSLTFSLRGSLETSPRVPRAAPVIIQARRVSARGQTFFRGPNGPEGVSVFQIAFRRAKHNSAARKRRACGEARPRNSNGGGAEDCKVLTSGSCVYWGNRP